MGKYKSEKMEAGKKNMYYLRFSLQVLRVYLGCQFYHPNINYITQKLYGLEIEHLNFILVYFLKYMTCIRLVKLTT